MKKHHSTKGQNSKVGMLEMFPVKWLQRETEEQNGNWNISVNFMKNGLSAQTLASTLNLGNALHISLENL